MSREPDEAFVSRLPIGERLPLDKVLGHELFPFEGDISTRVLEPARRPEPPRLGESEGGPCPVCPDPLEGALWHDERWVVRTGEGPSGLPIVAILQSQAHHDLEDLSAELAAELGVMIQRVARAIGQVPGVGRVHVNRWGDGSEHFHVWFSARPAGMWQMRGAMLAVWDDILPPIPAAEWERNRRIVAAALAAEGGEQAV